jgi:hypothetical protein
MSESAWWVNQFFLYFFGGMGVFFVGIGVLYGVSVWDKRIKAEIKARTDIEDGG